MPWRELCAVVEPSHSLNVYGDQAWRDQKAVIRQHAPKAMSGR